MVSYQVPKAPSPDRAPKAPSSDEVPTAPSPDQVNTAPSFDKVPKAPSPDEVPKAQSPDRAPKAPSCDEVPTAPPSAKVPPSVHAAKTFMCHHCSQTCSSMFKLKRHIKNKHGLEHTSTQSGKCLCLGCDFQCHCILDLRKHLACNNVLFKTDNVRFKNYAGKFIRLKKVFE